MEPPQYKAIFGFISTADVREFNEMSNVLYSAPFGRSVLRFLSKVSLSYRSLNVPEGALLRLLRVRLTRLNPLR